MVCYNSTENTNFGKTQVLHLEILRSLIVRRPSSPFLLRHSLTLIFEMEQDGLPLYSGPVDHFRLGFRSLENEMTSMHPIARAQKSQNSSVWGMKLDTVRRNYGSHMAMRLATEKSIFDHSHRVQGLESSNISLQTLMGSDSSISFDDFLNGSFLSSLFLLFIIFPL